MPDRLTAEGLAHFSAFAAANVADDKAPGLAGASDDLDAG
jgi:hypothetical protein